MRHSWKPEPSPVRVLLLCVHIASHLSRVTPVPQPTTAASVGTTMDTGSSSPMALTTEQCPALKVTWPAVDVPLNEPLTLSCTACSHFTHFSILYWMGNGSFIEHLPGQLYESSTSRTHSATHTQLQRALVLEELSPALRSTNFSCVFADPARVAQHHIVLGQLWPPGPMAASA